MSVALARNMVPKVVWGCQNGQMIDWKFKKTNTTGISHYQNILEDKVPNDDVFIRLKRKKNEQLK